MNFTLSPTRTGSRFISVLAELPVNGRSIMEVQLAAWRPGRYEIGNFAKNIRKFEVYSQDGVPLCFEKISKDRWKIYCEDKIKVRITYEYFAATLDAGSTFCGKDLFYVNPVNCLIFDPEYKNEPAELLLKVPSNYRIASSMTLKGNRLFAANFEELADSPIIASPTLDHHEFQESGCTFHLWFQGRHKLNIPQFIDDAKAYTREQVSVFGEIESPHYHYLFLFLPTRFHHGVEHMASTVIAMGPGEEFHTTERHHEFLAICSHELFHYWNVKRIRPAEMFPYDYTRQNYSRSGYVYEGITTYYGDYLLLRSGVFDFFDYLNQFNSDLQKHYENEGRYNYSVAESSFDTWLDGYVPGVPGRKVSIYTEGMLAALMLDLSLRNKTDNQSSLDTVMKQLYTDFYKNGKAYTEADFQRIIESIAQQSYEQFFQDFYWGRGQIEKHLPDYLKLIGCELVSHDSAFIHEGRYGFKISSGQKVVITAILEDSPAEQAGLSLNDEVILINNTPASAGTDWNQLYNLGGAMLVWNSIEGSKMIDLVPDGNAYYRQFKLRKTKDASAEQREFFKQWSQQEF